MSLTTVSRAVPAPSIRLELAADVGRQVPAFDQQLREAQHAVQRRADLVAHGGQELGLGLVGGQGPGPGGAGQLLAADQQPAQALLLGQGQAGGQAGDEQHADENLHQAVLVGLGPVGRDLAVPQAVDGQRDGDAGDDQRGPARAARAQAEGGQQRDGEQQERRWYTAGVEHRRGQAGHQQGQAQLLRRRCWKARRCSLLQQDQRGGQHDGHAQHAAQEPVGRTRERRHAVAQAQPGRGDRGHQQGHRRGQGGQQGQLPHGLARAQRPPKKRRVTRQTSRASPRSTTV